MWEFTLSSGEDIAEVMMALLYVVDGAFYLVTSS